MPKPRRKKPVFIDSMQGIADAIASEFGINCTRQTINYWRKHNPPFPPVTDGNRYDRDECFAWYRKNKANITTGSKEKQLELLQRAFDAKNEKTITQAAKEKFELDRLMGQYVPRDEAYRTTVAALQKLMLFTREEIEKRSVSERMEKLKALGVPDDLANQFWVWDKAQAVAAIDAIAARCEDESKGPDATSI